MGTIWKKKGWSSHFWYRVNILDFGTWEYTTKEDLNSRKQLFQLNLGLRLAQKLEIWSIFYEKMLV